MSRLIFEENSCYSERKLRNTNIEDFLKCIKIIEAKYFNEQEQKMIEEYKILLGKKLCENYRPAEEENDLIIISAKLYSKKIPLKVRKNIENFEEAHCIKTIYYKENYKNSRGEHFKILMGE